MSKIKYILALTLISYSSISQTALINNPCGLDAIGEIFANQPCSSVTTAGLSALYDPGSCNSAYADDGWVWFTGTGTTATITFNVTNGQDPVLHLFEADLSSGCSVLEVDCADAWGSGGTEVVSASTSLGTIYFVRVQNWNSN